MTSDPVEIARSPEEVRAYAFDPTNDPEWIGGIREVDLLTDPPLRAGSRVRRIARFMGQRIEYVMEVTQLEAPGRLTMQAVRSPFPMTVTYELAPTSRGTRASIQVRGDVTGVYRLAGPFLPRVVRQSVSADLRRLKRILESSPSAGYAPYERRRRPWTM